MATRRLGQVALGVTLLLSAVLVFGSASAAPVVYPFTYIITASGSETITVYPDQTFTWWARTAATEFWWQRINNAANKSIDHSGYRLTHYDTLYPPAGCNIVDWHYTVNVSSHGGSDSGSYVDSNALNIRSFTGGYYTYQQYCCRWFFGQCWQWCYAPVTYPGQYAATYSVDCDCQQQTPVTQEHGPFSAAVNATQSVLTLGQFGPPPPQHGGSIIGPSLSVWDDSVTVDTWPAGDQAQARTTASETATRSWTATEDGAGEVSYADGDKYIADATLNAPNGDTVWTVELTGGGDHVAVWLDGNRLYARTLNTPPTADAGGPYAADEGRPLTFDASASSDNETPDALRYGWDFNNDGTPDVFAAVTDHSFADGPADNPVTLTVCDPDDACASDTTTVRVANLPPLVAAGDDVTALRNAPIDLAGTWLDAAGALDQPFTWQWTLPDGTPGGTGDAGDTARATTGFALQGTYALTLTVRDADGDAGHDTLTVTVLNQPPVCTAARATPDRLWPVNHKFTNVTLGGLSDADGDPLALTISGVWQDEPVDSHGDGRNTPDAIIRGAAVDLRAERAGDGNGRIYHVLFTADDGHGGVCSGDVTVGVPHSSQVTAVDDGPTYLSTTP